MTTSHPFGGPGHTYRGGMPLGVYVPSFEEWCFDPFQEKSLGILSSLNGLILGEKGSGKSTTLKVIGGRFAMIGAGHSLMRIAINDHKPEGEDSEYTAWGEFLGCERFDIASRSVSPFEAGLHLGDLNNLEMATMLVEHVQQAPLIGSDLDALKAAVFMMQQTSEVQWTIQSLLKISLSLTPFDVEDYYRQMHGRMQQQIAQRIQRHTEDRREREHLEGELAEIYQRPDNLSKDAIIRSGEKVASLLGALAEGKYGRMLGGGDSLSRMYEQQAIVKDWRNVPKEAVSLMRGIDHRIEINAIERGLHNLYANIELDDEDHQSMKDLTYAKSKSLKSKISRSARKLSLSGSHGLDDYRQGGVGSELWGYGQNIIDDMGFFMVGRQPNRKARLDELQERLNLSQTDRDFLPEMPKWIFGIKLGESEPFEYVQLFPTPQELAMSATESANEAMVDRPGLNRARYDRVAEETGFALKER